MSILVTGFEPEAGGLNASRILVESLRDAPPPSLSGVGHLVHYEMMPLSSAQIRLAVLNAIAQHQPAFCLFIGQAPGRNRITLERIATNLKDFEVPDGEGMQPRGELIEADGPSAYWSNLPGQETLIACLNENGIPAGFSNHAGNHLCNQILYHALHEASDDNYNFSCSFVHIPILPVQVMQARSVLPFMPLDMLREGVALMLLELLARLPKVESGT